jgi:hypothetical protein
VRAPSEVRCSVAAAGEAAITAALHAGEEVARGRVSKRVARQQRLP